MKHPRLKCPHCGTVFQTGQRAPSKVVSCPACHAPVATLARRTHLPMSCPCGRTVHTPCAEECAVRDLMVAQ